MKNKPQSEDFAPLAGVNIIPVIDVSLVLLIILLATAPIMNNPGFEVKLPKAITSETKEKNVTISYANIENKGEQIAVNEKNTDWNKLESDLSAELKSNKDILVIVRADQGVQYGKVEQLMDIAKHAGATRIAIATQQDQSGHTTTGGEIFGAGKNPEDQVKK